MTEQDRDSYPQPLEALALEIDPVAIDIAVRFIDRYDPAIMTREEAIASLAGDIAAMSLMSFGMGVHSHGQERGPSDG